MHDVALERMPVDMTFQETHTCFGRIVEQLILPEGHQVVNVIIIRSTSRLQYNLCRVYVLLHIHVSKDNGGSISMDVPVCVLL